MIIKKIYLIIYIISFSFLFGDGLLFRGKSNEQLMNQPIPLAFANMVANNYNILPSQINPQRGTFLIIAPDGIIQYLGDFVSFKKTQGFDVDVIALSEAGESASLIKATIANKLAENPMLEYVLLIGDVDGFASFPSFYYGSENDVSDQKYTHILGDDNIPDVFIGRLSIDSLSDLAVIMAKTIQYVKNPLLYDSDWLSRGLVVAGNYSNSYPIPITPKWTSYWLRDELLDYGYNQIDTVFYPPVQQGAPFIIPSINDGVGIVNYRGWGDANGWHYPEFHTDDVNDLNNGWLTPVFFSWVCNSNDFANNVDPCLAESVLRGGTPSIPKGGVAFIGPSDLHTSTKYNNVINAYTFDAMLNHGVVELGPAMQAGQSGLLKEFPDQNDPGEAQEFYAHVYNILGDPSLPVYLDTPDQFTMNVEDIHANDGLVDLTVTNAASGSKVNYAVISIMSGDQLLSKGITDDEGRFLTSVNLSSGMQLEVYANKGGFIQGHKSIVIQPASSDITIENMTVINENGGDKPTLGELINLTIELKNTSENSTNAFAGEIIFSTGVAPNLFQVNVPTIASGGIESLNSIEFSCYSASVGNTIRGQLLDQSENIVFEFVIELELPVFDVSFENSLVNPNSEIETVLSVSNFSAGTYQNILIDISNLSEGADVTMNSTSDIFSNFTPFSTTSSETNYEIEIGDVSYGSNITFLVKFMKNGYSIYSHEVPLHIKPSSANIPVAPNNYGYWAYDDTDTGFDEKPTFDWIELDPNYGGNNGTYYQLGDDDHENIELPFTFKYHGIDYNQITVSSNGWTSFEPCYIDYFWNMSIPMYMGPKAMLAPFSDDLETIDTNNDDEIDLWIKVFTWYDELNGRFIIEWSRALNGYDEITEETFEIILYDQNSMPTESGDGVIEFQYLEIEDVDVTKNYSTVGIESPTKNYGIQYVFNNIYSPGAAPLANERVIRFTTEAPSNYVASLALDNGSTLNDFILSPAYPNPFNPVAHFDFIIPYGEFVKITVFDIMGREVTVLKNGMMAPGQYKIAWHGVDNFGKSVSSGSYFLVMKYGEKTKVQKLVFLK